MPNAPGNNPKTDDNQNGGQTQTGIVRDNRASAASNETEANTQKVNWPTAWAVVIGLAAFVGVSLLFYQGIQWIEDKVDSTVEKKLSEEVVLRKIAAQARPGILFDRNGAVVLDMGAGQYITSLYLAKTNGIDGIPTTRIYVDLKRHFAGAILVPMTVDSAEVRSNRRRLFAWEFEVRLHITHSTNDVESYRLELIH